MTTVSLDSLNKASEDEFTAALGDIFEHSPWVAQLAAKRRPFATIQDLHDAMMDALRAAPAETRLALVKAHPDLAGKAARSGAMTADSVSEQGSVGLDRLTEAEYARFTRLNDAYQTKFGIPFIVCVRRHTKDSILNEFERRLSQDSAGALDVAIDEIGRITALMAIILAWSAICSPLSSRTPLGGAPKPVQTGSAVWHMLHREITMS